MAPKRTSADHQVVVVLGMHKSGTTLISRILHHSGINMIEDDASGSYYEGNFFERKLTNHINKVLLDCEGKKSWQVHRKMDTSQMSATHDGLVEKAVSDLAREHKSWGFKDPRTCLTYEGWKKHLPAHKLVCVFRNDRQLHSHYAGKHRRRPWRGIYALRAWYDYNQCILDIIKEQGSNYVLIDYDELMAGDKEFARLEAFLARPLSDDRKPSSRSHRKRDVLFAFCHFMAKWLYGRDTEAMYAKLKSARVDSMKDDNG